MLSGIFVCFAGPQGSSGVKSMAVVGGEGGGGFASGASAPVVKVQHATKWMFYADTSTFPTPNKFSVIQPNKRKLDKFL
jgi:hypothetical protein